MGRHKGNSSRSNKSGKNSSNQKSANKTKDSPRPEGDALQIALVAGPAFRQAVKDKDCPAVETDPQTSSSGPGQRYRLENWSLIDQFLTWFKEGATSDNSAHLVFSSELVKENRAELHSLANKLQLESISQGVGTSRHTALYMQGCAPSKAQLTEDVAEKSKLLYDLAKARGITLSRDEAAEMFVNLSFSEEAQELWKREGELQLAIRKLNQFASKGQLEQLKALIKEHPDAASGNTREVPSGLIPLNCAAAQGFTACASALIEAGAHLEATDSFGMTALEACRKFEQMDIEALLLKAGAKDSSSNQFERPAEVGTSGAENQRHSNAELDRLAPALAASQSGRSHSDSEPTSKTVKSSFEGFRGPPIRGNVGDEEEETKKEEEETKNPLEEEPSNAPEDGEPLEEKEPPAAQMDPQQFPGGWVEPSQPPVVAPQALRNVPAVVGGRSLSSHLPEGLSREYTGSPNLKDPRAATRGMPGASAIALGRRIMQNASAESHRYGSARLSGDLDKFRYTEPSQPPAVTSGKVSGVPNVVGGQGTAHQVDSDKVQMVKPRGFRLHGTGQEPSKKSNRSRVEAWMESAPEEHSSLGSSNPQSCPDLQRLVNDIEAAKKAVNGEGSGGGDAEEAPSRAQSDKAGTLTASRKPEASERSAEAREIRPGYGDQAEAAESSDQGPGVASLSAFPNSQPPPAEEAGSKPKLRYQDPRGAITPTQPPTASTAQMQDASAPGQAGSAIQHMPLTPPQVPGIQALQADASTSPKTGQVLGQDVVSLPKGLPGMPAISSVEKLLASRVAAPYAEGTQPPGVALQSVPQVAAIVGGQRVLTEKDATNGVISKPDDVARMDAKLPTYGQKDHSAMDLGKEVIEDPTKQMDRHGSSGRSGNLDTALYVEPSQPPRGPGGKLAVIPSVVGGKRINKEAENTTSSSDPTLAGKVAGQAAEAEQGNRTRQEGLAKGARLRTPSFEFPRHTESLLGSSTTAEAMSRPKGLGKTQGLPAKRPNASKLNKSKSGDMQRTLSTEAVVGSPRGDESEAGPKMYGMLKDGFSNSLEKLSSVSSSLTETLRPEESPSWLHTTRKWVAENNTLVMTGVVAGAAAVAGLCWMKLQR